MIPDANYVYSAQEHSSTGFERRVFDQLIEDAKARKFDAIAVVEQSRFGRDLLKVHEAIEVLKAYGIRFFSGGREIDLYDPNDLLQFGVFSVIHAHYVNVLRDKSVANRIERARRGWPAVGSGPVGRELVNDTPRHEARQGGQRRVGEPEWRVIPEAQELLNQMYVWYVKEGIGLSGIAARLGWPRDKVTRWLIEQSRPTWRQEFKHRGKTYTFDTPVPPMLTPEQIREVKERARENKANNRGEVYSYALSHAVRCGVCGRALSGLTQKNAQGKEYTTTGMRQRLTSRTV